MITTKILLTPEEAAQLVSVGRTRIYALMASGEIESVRIGHSRRIPAEALERYVAGLRGTAAVSAA